MSVIVGTLIYGTFQVKIRWLPVYIQELNKKTQKNPLIQFKPKQ